MLKLPESTPRPGVSGEFPEFPGVSGVSGSFREFPGQSPQCSNSLRAHPRPRQLPWHISRRSRVVIPGFPHHVTQRGNNRRDVFFRDVDRKTYLELLGFPEFPGFPGFRDGFPGQSPQCGNPPWTPRSCRLERLAPQCGISMAVPHLPFWGVENHASHHWGFDYPRWARKWYLLFRQPA
jgi:hypothetical protein